MTPHSTSEYSVLYFCFIQIKTKCATYYERQQAGLLITRPLHSTRSYFISSAEYVYQATLLKTPLPGHAKNKFNELELYAFCSIASYSFDNAHNKPLVKTHRVFLHPNRLSLSFYAKSQMMREVWYILCLEKISHSLETGTLLSCRMFLFVPPHVQTDNGVDHPIIRSMASHSFEIKTLLSTPSRTLSAKTDDDLGDHTICPVASHSLETKTLLDYTECFPLFLLLSKQTMLRTTLWAALTVCSIFRPCFV